MSEDCRMIPGKLQNLEITMNRIASKFGATRIRPPLKSTSKRAIDIAYKPAEKLGICPLTVVVD